MTPAKLRSNAEAGQMTVLEPKDGSMLADAMEIADSCARADIECQCRAVDKAGKESSSNFAEWWWDTDSADVEDKEGIAQSLRYLEARGLVERHATNRAWVRFRVGVAG